VSDRKADLVAVTETGRMGRRASVGARFEWPNYSRGHGDFLRAVDFVCARLWTLEV